MNIEKDITTILSEAGRNGLSVKKIAFHVYNMNNELFRPINYDDVYRKVVAFIKKNNNGKCSMLISTGKRGYYRINMKYAQLNQLTFDFTNGYVAEEPATNAKESQTRELTLPFE